MSGRTGYEKKSRSKRVVLYARDSPKLFPATFGASSKRWCATRVLARDYIHVRLAIIITRPKTLGCIIPLQQCPDPCVFLHADGIQIIRFS
jgi:hypothetical protein